MKTIKIVSGIYLAVLLAIGAFQSNSFAQSKDSTQCTINMKVSGMMCPMCSKRIEGKLKTLNGTENVKADYKTGVVSLNVPDSSKVNKSQLKKTISDLGFELQDVKFTEMPNRLTDNKKQPKNNDAK